MSYIFLDESGDLGFDLSKKETSKFFVVTFVFADKKRPLEKVARMIHRGLRKKYRMRTDALHAAGEEPVTCLRFCRELAEKECKIMTVYLNKRRVYIKMQYEKSILYNYVTNILIDRIVRKRLIDKGRSVTLVAARRETNKFLNENFKNYLTDQAQLHHEVDLRVIIKTPSEEKALQTADMASWAIFRKYEYGDDSYYNILKPLIVEENPLFP